MDAAERAAERVAEFDRWVTWPEWAKDSAVTDCDVTLSFTDRLWVLVRGRFTVTAKVFTENVIGQTASLSRFTVNRRWPWQRHEFVGMYEGASPLSSERCNTRR